MVTHRKTIPNLNIMCQYVRALQHMTLCLPGRGFLDLEDMSIDTRNFHRDITQMELRLGDRNIDADLGIPLVSL